MHLFLMTLLISSCPFDSKELPSFQISLTASQQFVCPAINNSVVIFHGKILGLKIVCYTANNILIKQSEDVPILKLDVTGTV